MLVQPMEFRAKVLAPLREQQQEKTLNTSSEYTKRMKIKLHIHESKAQYKQYWSLIFKCLWFPYRNFKHFRTVWYGTVRTGNSLLY